MLVLFVEHLLDLLIDVAFEFRIESFLARVDIPKGLFPAQQFDPSVYIDLAFEQMPREIRFKEVYILPVHVHELFGFPGSIPVALLKDIQVQVQSEIVFRVELNGLYVGIRNRAGRSCEGVEAVAQYLESEGVTDRVQLSPSQKELPTLLAERTTWTWGQVVSK